MNCVELKLNAVAYDRRCRYRCNRPPSMYDIYDVWHLQDECVRGELRTQNRQSRSLHLSLSSALSEPLMCVVSSARCKFIFPMRKYPFPYGDITKRFGIYIIIIVVIYYTKTESSSYQCNGKGNTHAATIVPSQI